jgi:hypothetical protein
MHALTMTDVPLSTLQALCLSTPCPHTQLQLRKGQTSLVSGHCSAAAVSSSCMVVILGDSGIFGRHTSSGHGLLSAGLTILLSALVLH